MLPGIDLTLLRTCKNCGRPLGESKRPTRRKFCHTACRASYHRFHSVIAIQRIVGQLSEEATACHAMADRLKQYGETLAGMRR